MSRHVAIAPLDFDLVAEDGVPMDKPRHRVQMNLTLDGIERAMEERGRHDYYAGGDMFLYFSPEQARAVYEDELRRAGTNEPPDDRIFRGPDVFFVSGVDPHERETWTVWEEDQRFPDVIFELMSASTAYKDKGEKKDLYEQVFRTSEYFLWDPYSFELLGFRLLDHKYQPLRPDDRGWLWSRELGLYLGSWHGTHRRVESTWLRFFDGEGRMIPMSDERAEEERQRAERAEEELARLRALHGE